jgi:acetylornithine/succinyldiaminopimelate/putrescine aminotransferase
MYPVSAVLANNNIMKVIHPGQHGSTFGEILWLALLRWQLWM